MRIIPIKDIGLMTRFLLSQKPNQFLQSYEWGEFQKSLGRPIERLYIVDEEIAPAEEPVQESILAAMLAVIMPLPYHRSYLYLPRGPIVYLEVPVPDQNDMWRSMSTQMEEYAKKHKALFLRMDPAIDRGNRADLRAVMTNHYPVEYLSSSVQPDTTLILDLSPDAESILNSMAQKTRYNIRLAEKKGVRVTRTSAVDAVEDFWKLLSQTAERDGFSPHPKDYYAKMMEAMAGDWDDAERCRIQFFKAELKGQLLAMNMMCRFGDTVTYLHGASSNEGRNAMAPHLLQWEAIKDAKTAGATRYDFWGVAPTNNPKHPWAGITRFKKGFGGTVEQYWGTVDIVYHSFWYVAYSLLKKFK
ncbi:MAG: peptidoglycan bridge formation glycyltransferase FemA/FemB family protein [bacterium]|nr:peptidoglycan bridge formation glycyltransferase FemA/FemB family protein [bacterium]